jgi:acyl-CoA thioester hydrolase
MDPIHRHQFKITREVVDGNRHVNNVVYVRWMQDAAIRHAEATGCSRITSAHGATWVVRSHRVEYRTPAFEGDTVTVLTWVANIRRVRSLRRYKFLRAADGEVLAEGETDWVFVDASAGRPKAIPEEIRKIFQIPPDGPEP